MMRYVGVVGVPVLIAFACLAGLHAFSGSTGSTLKSIGLTGQWSFNCASNNRSLFDVPTFGTPTMTGMVEKEVVEQRDIQNAALLTEDKIRIRYRINQNKRENAVTKAGEIWESVLVRFGNKFESLSLKQVDGPKIAVDGGWFYKEKDGKFERTNRTAGFLEKCLTDS
jgi:hypothetical protein